MNSGEALAPRDWPRVALELQAAAARRWRTWPARSSPDPELQARRAALGIGATLRRREPRQRCARPDAVGSSGLAAAARAPALARSPSAAIERRAEEWTHQVRQADKELEQIATSRSRPRRCARSRRARARQPRAPGRATRRASTSFMRGRSSRTASSTTGWSASSPRLLPELPARLRHGQARRARVRFELGVADSSFIQFGYWDSLKKGLLAGERLVPRPQAAGGRPTSTRTRASTSSTKHVSLADARSRGAACAARDGRVLRDACPRRCSTSTIPATTCAGSSRSA